MFEQWNRRPNPTAVFFAAALLLASGTTWAINKCVDQAGKAIYTDRPCAAGAASSSVDLTGARSDDAHSSSNIAWINDNLKALQGCAAGLAGACLRKDIVDKKCLVDAKGFITRDSAECRAYKDDRNRFRDLRSQCDRDAASKACAILDCAAGQPSGCERMGEWKTETQAGEDRRKQAAAQQGRPSGGGWYMSQNWYRQADGRQTASIACNERSTIILIKKPAAPHRIMTTVTGESYFLSVDEAARKGCAVAK